MRRTAAVVALLGVGWLGCATLRSGPETTDDGLVETPTRGRGTLFVRPDHHVGDYDRIWVAQMGITYARGQKPLATEQEDEIFDMLEDGLAIDMDADSVVSALEPGPCTVKFGLYVTDLELYESPTVGSQKNIVESYGVFTLVMEFRDSETDLPLVRYGQRRSLGSGIQEGKIEPDMHRLGLAIDAAMEDVGDQLARVVPNNTNARGDLGCRGLLGLSAEVTEPQGGS